MAEQRYLETEKIEDERNHPGRVRALLVKRQAQIEVREQREIEVKRRTAIRLRMMVASIERDIANLDASISSELALARVRKPFHFAHPIAARTMQARRENLKATVAALSDRLALTNVIISNGLAP
jgi:hypothetical protein